MIASASCLVLCVVTLLLWGRSYRTGVGVLHVALDSPTRLSRQQLASLADGIITLKAERLRFDTSAGFELFLKQSRQSIALPADATGGHWYLYSWANSHLINADRSLLARLGFSASNHHDRSPYLYPDRLPDGQVRGLIDAGNAVTDTRTINFPAWSLALLFLLLGGPALAQAARNLRRERCARRGFTLRDRTDPCPKCGKPIPHQTKGVP